MLFQLLNQKRHRVESFHLNSLKNSENCTVFLLLLCSFTWILRSKPLTIFLLLFIVLMSIIFKTYLKRIKMKNLKNEIFSFILPLIWQAFPSNFNSKTTKKTIPFLFCLPFVFHVVLTYHFLISQFTFWL